MGWVILVNRPGLMDFDYCTECPMVESIKKLYQLLPSRKIVEGQKCTGISPL